MTSGGTQYWTSGSIPLIAPEILGDIISSVADVSLVVSERGEVLSVLVNPQINGLGELQSFKGQNVRSFLAKESVVKFDARLADFVAGKQIPAGTELNHKGASGASEYPIRYSFHRIGPDGAILMLGRDLRPVAEMQQQLVEAQLVLERDYEAHRESDTRLRVMMQATSEPILFVALHNGKITDANRAAAKLFGVDQSALTGKLFKSEIDSGTADDPLKLLGTHAGMDRLGALHMKLKRRQANAAITPFLFRAGGERLLMCRFGMTGSPAATDDQMQQHLSGLFEQGPDAILFTDDSGRILAANDSFLKMVDSANDREIKGRDLGDFLSRGSVDLKVMQENALRNGRMRLFPTKLRSVFGNSSPVEIAITAIAAGDETIFAYVLRDTSRIEQARPVNTPVTDDKAESVMELVGSASLKEIVAETTDVVERMCIETAIELTQNNRVAAAEMLGLSRQSLYVKLRKFGIGNRDDTE